MSNRHGVLETWKRAGLRETGTRSRIVIDKSRDTALSRELTESSKETEANPEASPQGIGGEKL